MFFCPSDTWLSRALPRVQHGGEQDEENRAVPNYNVAKVWRMGKFIYPLKSPFFTTVISLIETIFAFRQIHARQNDGFMADS
jgi:hypothetical protein